MAAPVFIIGNPRSGTTLLRLMLTCHPHICIPPECGFAIWLAPKYQAWTPACVEDFARDVLTCTKIETWRWDAEGLAAFLRAEDPQTYARAAELVYVWYAHCQGRDGVRWGDKNNFHLAHIETLRGLFPDCVFVHIVRDPRAVVSSYRELARARIQSRYAPNLPAEIQDAAMHWRGNIRTIQAAFGRLHWHGVHQVRFEDVLADPRSTLEHLCDALGETFDARMLEYDTRNREADLEPMEFDPWKAKTRRPLIREEAQRYLANLTVDDRERIDRLVAAELAHFNYPC